MIIEDTFPLEHGKRRLAMIEVVCVFYIVATAWCQISV